MYQPNYQTAKDHAIERARDRRKPYVVLLDTGGNYHVEPFDPQWSCHRSALDVFFPAVGSQPEGWRVKSESSS